jgi:hypothetical protein
LTYEEKIIDGVLHRRCSFTDQFKPFTAAELTELLLKERVKGVSQPWQPKPVGPINQWFSTGQIVGGPLRTAYETKYEVK